MVQLNIFVLVSSNFCFNFLGNKKFFLLKVKIFYITPFQYVYYEFILFTKIKIKLTTFKILKKVIEIATSMSYTAPNYSALAEMRIR